MTVDKLLFHTGYDTSRGQRSQQSLSSDHAPFSIETVADTNL